MGAHKGSHERAEVVRARNALVHQLRTAGPVKVTVIDASGLVIGRLASSITKRLLAGEEIHVVNAEKAVITGTRDSIMARFWFKRDVGTRRTGPFYPRMPHMMLKRTVRGMFSYQETPTHREAYKRLKCWIGVPDHLEGKPLETIEGAKTRAMQKMTLGDIATALGAKF